MTRKATIPFLVLMLFTVPLAQCFTIDNPTYNFVGPKGGNTRYATTAIIDEMNTLTFRIINFLYTGYIVSEVGFDCDTGANMTILNVEVDSLTYNITSVGTARGTNWEK